MDVALSRSGAWVLRVFFVLVVAFLYAPIVLLVIFSFNDSQLPSFPLSGFTLHWYRQFLTNADLKAALETSAIIAAISSVGAVLLGILASIALVRRRFRGKSPVSALLLSPLVIPYVVFGISLLLLFHAAGIPRSILTVVIGHVVISLPYTILVLMPRLQQIDVSLEEAAYDLGASRLRTFRSITMPLLLPAVVSAFLIAFTTSFDEYAVASFVVGPKVTFPIYLYSALRFPSQLPQVIAVAVVVISRLARRRGSRRGRPALRRAAARRSRELGDRERSVAEQRRMLRRPSGPRPATRRRAGASDSSARRWRPRGRPASRHETACTSRGRRSRRPSPRAAIRLPEHRLRPVRSGRARDGPRRVAHRRACRANRHDDPLALAEARHRVPADDLVHGQLERVQRADEVGDERRRADARRSRAGRRSARRWPPFMTAIRSDIASASSWSCVT